MARAQNARAPVFRILYTVYGILNTKILCPKKNT